MKRAYYALRRALAKASCRLRGEIYFAKYDTSGPYHWTFYYEQQEPYYVKLVNTVCDLLPEGGRVLDVGCGDGLIANVMTERRGCRVVGIDVHALAISFAKEKNRNDNEFHVNSAYDIQFGSDFDGAVAVEVAEHLNRPEAMIREVHKALKPEGRFVVTLPASEENPVAATYDVRDYTPENLSNDLGDLFTIVEERVMTNPGKAPGCRLYVCTRNPGG